MKFLYSLILICTICFACEKSSTIDINEPIKSVSATPELTFDSINATIIKHSDNLVFYIKYLDGDGDLGSPNADEHTLYVVDSRENITSTFHVQPLNPEPNQANTITGIMQVHLNNVIVLNDSLASEKARFSIYIFDQNGHKSNEVTSPEITINR